MDRIAGRFTRVEPRWRIGRLVLGLLSDLPRKNCWTIERGRRSITVDARSDSDTPPIHGQRFGTKR